MNQRYKVEKELGRGAIGIVYLAHDTHLHGKPVVIKVLQQAVEQSALSEWYKKKFQQEVEALARLNHPGIIGVLDSGAMDDGRQFFVMQFVEGRNLRSAMKEGQMPLARVASIIQQMGSALSVAHEKGVWHRDLKPENIMLQRFNDDDEQVRIIDFGLATVKDSQVAVSASKTMVAGTPGYMAPEQIKGQPSAASDIYALGSITYEMLTGRTPFLEQLFDDLYNAQKQGISGWPSQLRPQLPVAVDSIILKALTFDEKHRYQRVRDFSEALAATLLLGESNDVGQHLLSDKGNRPPVIENEHLKPVGGAVPLFSEFYIVRPADEEFRAAIARRDSIVLVKGARQMGKTSLLARGLQQARSGGAKVVLTDFQKLNATSLASVESFFLTLAEWIAEQLDLDAEPEQTWNPRRGASINFERYLRREILGKITTPLVWGLDEVDRLFTCAFGSEVFGLFRSWHNERSLDPEGPWQRLTMAIAYATEAHLFITDLNQSPFNVGTRLTLDDFTLDQVAELNRRYGAPLHQSGELASFYRLVGGQPYLVRRGLHEMTAQPLTLAEFEAVADRDEGPFGDHLRRILVLLAQDDELCEVVKTILRGKPCPNQESFYRLRSAGVMAGEASTEARPRCQLYANYLERHLL